MEGGGLPHTSSAKALACLAVVALRKPSGGGPSGRPETTTTTTTGDRPTDADADHPLNYYLTST
eukprot:12909349-Prorocentrum_lima.AAC.1